MRSPLWQPEAALNRVQLGNPIKKGVYIVRGIESGGRPELYAELHSRFLQTDPFICVKPRQLLDNRFEKLLDYIGSDPTLIILEATRRKHFITPEILFNLIQLRIHLRLQAPDWARYFPVLVTNTDWVYETEPNRLETIRGETERRKVARQETTDLSLLTDLELLFRTVKSGILNSAVTLPSNGQNNDSFRAAAF